MQERPLESLIDSFEHQCLPQSEWTHRAHLRVALHYLRLLEPDMALDIIREQIQQLNLFHRVFTTPERGYHETRTRVWLAVLLHGIECGKCDEELLAEYSGVDVVSEYYYPESLNSWEARIDWVAPDKAVLPIDPGPWCEITPDLITFEEG